MRNHGAIFCIDTPHHTRLGPGNWGLFFYFLRKKGIFVRVKSKPLNKDTYSQNILVSVRQIFRSLSCHSVVVQAGRAALLQESFKNPGSSHPVSLLFLRGWSSTV